MPEVESKLDDETLRHLQTLMVRAVLLGEPLPGSGQPVSFPDLRFLLRQPAIPLSDENLAGPISIEGLPKPLPVLDPDALAAQARDQGEVAYLRFHPPRQEGETVRLTLEASLLSADPDQHPLGLGGIQAVFQLDGQEWNVVSPPSSYAT